MSNPDYTTIAPHQEGDNLSNRDYALREEERRFGSAFVAGQEDLIRLEYRSLGLNPLYGRR